ncbi:MAG: hypothetical protein V1701_06735 [Planctomycetota bacterium]
MKKVLWLAMLLTPVIIMLICGCSERSRKAAELAKQGWGAQSNGLVPMLSGPSGIEVDGPFILSFNIKNINSEPVTISDNDQINFTITDQNNQPIQWTRIVGSAGATKVITLKPDETYTLTRRLDTAGTFIPSLKSGMKLSITAAYDEPSTKSKLVTKPLSSFIRENTWGEAVNGLRCYLRNVPEVINVADPIYLEVVVENTDLQNPVVLRSSPDNTEKPQIDIEIQGNGSKTVFKSKRSESDRYGFIKLVPGAKIYTTVVLCTKDEFAKLKQVAGEQRTVATDKKMKTASLPAGCYAITAFYSHLVEKGRKYPKDWKNGWTGTIKSNTALSSFIGGATPAVSAPAASVTIEIRPNKGKAKTIKNSKDVANIQKSLANLKPLKKPSKSKVLGVVTVNVPSTGQFTYKYSSAYLLQDGSQYQIPDSLRKYLP